MSHSPFMNLGYVCAEGGMLKTEFFNADASRLDNFAARPSAALLTWGSRVRGRRRKADEVAAVIVFVSKDLLVVAVAVAVAAAVEIDSDDDDNDDNDNDDRNGGGGC